MNWEQILIAAIGPVLVIIGLIYQEYRKRKNAEDANDKTVQARREPTWNELVTENRNQRVELSAQGEAIDELRQAMTNLERKMDRKVNALENVLRDTAAQWPSHVEPPVFDSGDLTELLDNNIPWKNRIRPMKGLA